ncbi:MAG: hypothetical protein QM765_37100 [Myxococcales bacterium]
MSSAKIAVLVLKALGLTVLYAALMTVGTSLFPIPGIKEAFTPEEQQRAGLALLAVGAIDTLVLGAIAWATRARGFRLYAAMVPIFWGVKTFTSQIEAVWFMPNVTGAMFPMLLGMTVPLCLVFPAALMAALGRWKRDPALEPAWRAPAMSRAERALKVGLLAAIVYPVLFFAFGYFVAWQSQALRDFYGGAVSGGVVAHFSALFARDPLVWPFEAARGLLWIAFALPVLRTVRGPAWLGPVLVGLLFCFVQNDVHLMPNPLMGPEVRLFHFVETGSSNFLWALAIGWLLGRSHARRASPASGESAAAAG